MKNRYNIFIILSVILLICNACAKKDSRLDVNNPEQEPDNVEVVNPIVGEWVLISISEYDETDLSIANENSNSSDKNSVVTYIFNGNGEVVIDNCGEIAHKFWSVNMEILSIGDNQEFLNRSYIIEEATDTELTLSYYDIVATSKGSSSKLVILEFKNI